MSFSRLENPERSLWPIKFPNTPSLEAAFAGSGKLRTSAPAIATTKILLRVNLAELLLSALNDDSVFEVFRLECKFEVSNLVSIYRYTSLFYGASAV